MATQRSDPAEKGVRPFRAYAFSNDPFWASMHISCVHRIYVGDVKTLAELRECHDLAHEDEQGFPHEHGEPEPVEEWTWDG